MKKIIITGGHHNSALVVARLLRDHGTEVTWIGHRYAAAHDTNDSAEYTEVTEAGFPFIDLKAGKLGATVTPGNIIRIPFGLIVARRLVRLLRPDAVLSFGGYLGATVGVAAHLDHIPVYVHEQTVIAGKANRLVSAFAKRVYITWPQSSAFFPKGKTLLVGLPLRSSVMGSIRKSERRSGLPTLLILGGKLGSHVINQFVFSNIEPLLDAYTVVHQTGTSSATGDLESARSRKAKLPAGSADRYTPVGYIGEAEIGKYLGDADVVMGRSGAHTTYELALLGIPAVLVPLMTTYGREQYRQAQVLVDAGNAVMLPQNMLSIGNVLPALEDALLLHTRKLPLPSDAADRIVSDMVGTHGNER